MKVSLQIDHASCNCFVSFVITNECDKRLRVAQFKIEAKIILFILLIQFLSSRFAIFRKNRWITLLRSFRNMREFSQTAFIKESSNLRNVHFITWLSSVCEHHCVAIRNKIVIFINVMILSFILMIHNKAR